MMVEEKYLRNHSGEKPFAGAHHPLTIRTKFYDIFLTKFSIFASFGKVYPIGDTNARLGSLLCDENMLGTYLSIRNLSNFLDLPS